jgi:hypothetical protein
MVTESVCLPNVVAVGLNVTTTEQVPPCGSTVTVVAGETGAHVLPPGPVTTVNKVLGVVRAGAPAVAIVVEVVPALVR